MSYNRITMPGDFQIPQRTETGLNLNNITALDDRPGLTSTELKARFDRAGGDLLTYLSALVTQLNALIGTLEAPGSAANIGAVRVWPEDHSGGSVQAKLIALKEYMDGLVIQAGAGDMAKSVYDTNNDGAVNNSDKLGGLSSEKYLKTFWDLTNVTSPEGYGFTVHKPNNGGILQNTIGWNDMKAVLKTYFDTIYTGSTASGSSTTNSTTGRSITHTFGNIAATAYRVTITPTLTAVPTNGTTGGLGEVYVVKNADGTFSVYNTGITGIAFDWQATKA